MIEVTILVPQADNDGVYFTTEHQTALAKKACELFGGYSFIGGAQGGWIDENKKLYQDQHRRLAVCINSIRDFAKVIELVEFVKVSRRQLAVYVQYLGQAEII